MEVRLEKKTIMQRGGEGACIGKSGAWYAWLGSRSLLMSRGMLLKRKDA